MVGDIAVQLDAISTAADTAWIAFLQDVDADGTVTGAFRHDLRDPQKHVGAGKLRRYR